jgi:zinc/manganese transport system substrate-binding protein
MRGLVRLRSALTAGAVALLAPALLASCTSDTSSALPTGNNGVLRVVAAENFWGSIASQLGGKQANVTSIVSDPNTDPHDYESNPSDARLLASANFVILNGAGYDTWANQLLSAQPAPDRTVFTVADLLGKKDGDNPHFWYDPAYVFEVMSKITADYKVLEPAQSPYFSQQYSVTMRAFAPYGKLLTYIRQHFAGQPVASTESILQYLAEYLHLDLVTPYSFMRAVAEGTDPPTQSVATFVRQIQEKDFKVLVYNVQTVTPLTTSMKQQAAAQNIPVIGVSETIQPPIDTFEEWMSGELSTLVNALNAGALGS